MIRIPLIADATYAIRSAVPMALSDGNARKPSVENAGLFSCRPYGTNVTTAPLFPVSRLSPKQLVIVASFSSLWLIAGCNRDDRTGGGRLPDKTHFLLITLDTTRADRIGCYGYAAAHTPTLDGLAARGMLFEDAQSIAPLTLPSHATMLTGLFPREHGLRVNGKSKLSDSIPTLATLLKGHGYRTGAFVSAFVLDKRFGLDRGFDHFDDEVEVRQRGGNTMEAERPADAVTAKALDWLNAQSNQPFFCWIHYYDPHEPYFPPPAFRSRHSNPYDGEIAFMDSEVGKVIEWFKKRGLQDQTLIVVAGDHGEAFGEHGEMGHAAFVHEANLHVPLFVVYPKVVVPGRVKVPVSLVDLFPTILDLFGLPHPDGLKGQSLVGALTGGQPEARTCYAESEHTYSIHTWAQQRALMTDSWKFISSTRPELYERKGDRRESRNVAADHPDVVKGMMVDLYALYEKMSPVSPVNVGQSQETARKLESLGYVSSSGTDRPDEVLTPGLPDPKDMVEVMRGLQQAHTLEVEGRTAEALSKLEMAKQRSPQSVEIRRRVGKALLRLDRTSEAIEALTEAMHIDPANSGILRALAEAYLQAKQFARAVEHYELLLELLPDDPATLDELGSALLEAGKVDQAIARLQEALRIKPEYGEAMADLGAALMAKGALDDAEKMLQKAAAMPGSAAQAHFLLGRLAARRNQKDLVFKNLEKAVELKPGYVKAVEALTEFYLTSGRTGDALRILRNALQDSPGNVGFSLTLAEILATSKYDELRNGEEAVRITEPLIGRIQGTRALIAFAAAKAETGDFESAIQSAEKALAIAQSPGQERVVPIIQKQLEAYRSKRPFRNSSF